MPRIRHHFPQLPSKPTRFPEEPNVFPNSLGRESGHADATGRTFYGRTNLEGVAYGVSHVDNWWYDRYYRAQIVTGDSIGEKVTSVSVSIGSTNCPSCTETENQNYDNYAATHGTIIAAGVGNGHPGPPYATAYNMIGVAAFGTIYSSVGPAPDGRSKPDITVPARSTSFSTPLVAGAATILVQAAGPILGASDPRTVKALLLNGAVKPLYQPTTAERWTHTSTAPLDARYGVGVLNVFNSYKQFQAGRTPVTMATTSTDVPASVAGVIVPARLPSVAVGSVAIRAGWDFNSIASTTGADRVNHYI